MDEPRDFPAKPWLSEEENEAAANQPRVTAEDDDEELQAIRAQRIELERCEQENFQRRQNRDNLLARERKVLEEV